jgi:teichoic acid transport system permease protein
MSTVTQYSDVEYVFEPHSSTMPNIRQYLKALWDRRQFMDALAHAEMRTERSRTVLGNLWGVLNPLFNAGIYYFLYTVLRPGTNHAFLPVLITNFFLFGLTMSALLEGGSSIRRGKSLMLNSTFPRALLPLTSIYKNLRAFVPAVGVLLVVFPLAGGRVGPGLLVLPLMFTIHVVMNIGIALGVSAYEVVVPDGHNVVQYANRILLFATPVIYPVTLLPDAARMVLQFQPLYSVFACYQAIFGGRMPSLGLVALSALWAGVLLVVGGRFFLRREREFALHL